MFIGSLPDGTSRQQLQDLVASLELRGAGRVSDPEEEGESVGGFLELECAHAEEAAAAIKSLNGLHWRGVRHFDTSHLDTSHLTPHT